MEEAPVVVMKPEVNIIVTIPGLDVRRALATLRTAIRNVDAKEPGFLDRIMARRIECIIDSPPGTVTLPRADAETLVEELARQGHQCSMASPPTATHEERNRARAEYIARLRG